MSFMRSIGVVIRTPYPWVKAYGPHIFVAGLVGVALMFWLLFRVETAVGRTAATK
jgi:hypothetical protein